MKRNLKLIVAYDGTRYFGWQKNNTGPSIEDELEKALAQILRHPVSLQAASRTDAGVHAEGQIVNFLTEHPIELARLQKSLNALLPKDITIRTTQQAPDAFHPTLDAVGKEYHYNLCLGCHQLPFHRAFSWHFSYPLDLCLMKQAADQLTGTHDFSAFTNDPKEDNIRHISSISIDPGTDSRLKISVSGTNFLYKMVRNLVGTIVYVGAGKIDPAEIELILSEKKRELAGVTAPAHGLTLKQVFYD